MGWRQAHSCWYVAAACVRVGGGGWYCRAHWNVLWLQGEGWVWAVGGVLVVMHWSARFGFLLCRQCLVVPGATRVSLMG